MKVRQTGTMIRKRRQTMSHLALVWVLGFTLLFGTATTVPSASDEASSTAVGSITTDGEQLTQYRALRRMHVRSDRLNQEGWLNAWTELDENGFRYTIVDERGSEYVRDKVMKALLKREQELIADGQAGRAALTEANYEFTEGAERDDGLRYVTIKPKRKDVTLVDGHMVLSANDGELLRVEGKLAKNPSFWTSLVNIVRRFAKIDGVQVPVSTESIAKVKFAGQSRLDVTYEYESINGRPVSSQGRLILASGATR